LIWTEAFSLALEEIKIALTSSSVLGYQDFRKEFILDTEASFNTTGAVLSQKDDFGYKSNSLWIMNNHEKGY